MLIVHNRFTFNCALNKQKPLTRTLHIRYILIFLIAPLTRSPYPVASNCLPRLLSQSFLATFKTAFSPRKWKLRFVCERTKLAGENTAERVHESCSLQVMGRLRTASLFLQI